MAPYKYHGALNICFQLCSTIGIQVAYILNYFTARHKNGWRISFGLAAIPALIFTIRSFFLPDTPNSLIEQRKQEEAKRMLRDIRGTHDVDQEFSDLVAASVESKKIKNHWFSMLKRKYRPQLVFAILISFFQQLTGVNVFMLLSPVLFKTTGRQNDPPSIYPIAMGMVNSAATIVSMKFADELGTVYPRWHPNVHLSGHHQIAFIMKLGIFGLIYICLLVILVFYVIRFQF